LTTIVRRSAFSNTFDVVPGERARLIDVARVQRQRAQHPCRQVRRPCILPRRGTSIVALIDAGEFPDAVRSQ
jgi:hypothetical protein